MSDHFYGWERATVSALNHDYPGIETPRDLYDALLGLWCADTCAPRMRSEWTPDNPTLGQCSITAFLVQDIFGGQVYGVPLKDGGFHCFNVVDGRRFDLTSQQFGDFEWICLHFKAIFRRLSGAKSREINAEMQAKTP